MQNASLDDSSTYVVLARTLQLFLVIEEYAATNKTLKAVWEERKSANLTLIRDLVSRRLGVSHLPSLSVYQSLTHRIDNQKPSTPLSVCRELALQIVQDLPSSLLTKDTLSKVRHRIVRFLAAVIDEETDVPPSHGRLC